MKNECTAQVLWEATRDYNIKLEKIETIINYTATSDSKAVTDLPISHYTSN